MTNINSDKNENKKDKLKKVSTEKAESEGSPPQPVVTADGHSPRPIGAIAKPRAKKNKAKKNFEEFEKNDPS